MKDAHKREKTVRISDSELGYREIEVTEEFLVQQEELLLFTVYSLWQASLRTSGAVDSDVMSALDAAIRTYLTLGSGLLYETRADNAIALGVQRLLTGSLTDYRRIRDERDAFAPVRDSDVVAVLVFLHRLGQQNQNGRPRGRLFIHLLQRMTPESAQISEPAPRIIV